MDLALKNEIKYGTFYLDYSSETDEEIENLSELFKYTNLKYLILSNFYLETLDILPNTITVLHCSSCCLDSLDNLPLTLIELYCDRNELTSLDYLPYGLKKLECNYNKLINIDNLPSTVEYLECCYNDITNIDNLPLNIKVLKCNNNKIIKLDYLPSALQILECNDNNLESLCNLPHNLEELYCSNNKIKLITNFPNTLKILDCHKNYIITLINLTNSIKILNCSNNSIINIERLPNQLNILDCSFNELLILPILPSSLLKLDLHNNLFDLDYKSLQNIKREQRQDAIIRNSSSYMKNTKQNFKSRIKLYNKKTDDKDDKDGKDQILYISYLTNSNNLENILESEYIFTSYERIKNIYKNRNTNFYDSIPLNHFTHEFPGVCMKLCIEDIIKEYPCMDVIELLFGVELLDQHNYHINLYDNKGYISENLTYSKFNIDKLPDISKLYDNNYDMESHYNEIVFHDKISIKLLTGIFCNNEGVYNEIKSIIKYNTKINKNYLNILKLNSNYPENKLHIPKEKQIYLDKTSLPNFVFYFDKEFNDKNQSFYHEKYINTMEFNKQIARIANIDDKVLETFNDSKELENYMEKKGLFDYYYHNREKQNWLAIKKLFN